MKKSTLIFLLLAVAAGTALWYFEFKREKPADTKSETKPAFSFKEEDITGLKITRAGEKGAESIAMEKRGSDWWMTQPVDSAVDSNNVGSVAFRTSSARIGKTIAATPENLGNFGLTAPQLTLEIKLKDGKNHRVRFGDKDFTGSDVYTFLDDGKDVTVLNVELFSAVDKPVLEFRDRRISNVDEGNIVRVRVKNKAQTLVAEKDASGKWMVREPVAQKGKELISTRIFLTLSNAQAEEIIDQPTAAQRARMVRPEVEIELTANDGKVTKYFAAPDDKDKAKALFGSSTSPQMFRLQKSTLETLNFKAADVVQEPPKEEKAEKPAEKKP